jgi:hypothetical protein
MEVKGLWTKQYSFITNKKAIPVLPEMAFIHNVSVIILFRNGVDPRRDVALQRLCTQRFIYVRNVFIYVRNVFISCTHRFICVPNVLYRVPNVFISYTHHFISYTHHFISYTHHFIRTPTILFVHPPFYSYTHHFIRTPNDRIFFRA